MNIMDYAEATVEAKAAIKELDKLLPLMDARALEQVDRLIRAASQLREWIVERVL